MPAEIPPELQEVVGFLLCPDSALLDCHERAGPMLADKHGLYKNVHEGVGDQNAMPYDAQHRTMLDNIQCCMMLGNI